MAYNNNNNNNNFSSGSFSPSAGFASRGKNNNVKRLSVALPPTVNSISEDSNPLPRATSRSHLLAGLRTAPKSPVSAPHHQTQHAGSQWANAGYDPYNQGHPQTATFGMNQYVMNAGQQTYALPEQVLAPPSLYEHDDEMDPNVLEQLQLTGMFLAQRQQQLQQQLANITAAANQFQGLNTNLLQQQQLAMLGQQHMQSPMEVPGQPGLFVVFNPAIGQYQYIQQQQAQPQHQQQQHHHQQQLQTPRRTLSPLSRSGTMPNLAAGSPYESPRPVFRSEVTPPPVDTPMQNKQRSITPPKKTSSPQTSLEHVQPLPPPSANAFRRGHKKVTSLSLQLGKDVAEAPKTSSAALFGSARSAIPAAPMTGTFGPGNARAGEHPIRQPRGPPNLEELIALPTANHEGSKNFAARRRRRALDGLMRASSVRRSMSGASASSPTSELSLQSSEDDEPDYYRKQSPIGSERSAKRGSQSSLEGSAPNSTVQTPATEDCNIFDMRSFYKQLPTPVEPQFQERKKMMLGVLSAAEKRRSVHF